jgi:hypothetical protein
MPQSTCRPDANWEEYATDESLEKMLEERGLAEDAWERRMDAVGGDRGKVDVWNPVQRAFRTAGLVRGRYTYAVIVDDIAASDDNDHTFTWSAHVPGDLVMKNLYFRPMLLEDPEGGESKPEKADVDFTGRHLKPKPAPGLMTVELEPAVNFSTDPKDPLDAKGEPKKVFRMIFLDQKGDITLQTLPRIEVFRDMMKAFRTGVVGRDPQFRVLLIATDSTDSVRPSVTKTPSGAYRLRMGSQVDVIEFKPQSNGRTGIAISRQPAANVKAETFSFGEGE